MAKIYDDVASIKSNADAFKRFILTEPAGTVIALLNHLGDIDSVSTLEPLLDLLSSNNSTIRTLALKNLAKTKCQDFVSRYVSILKNDICSEVRREAVSAIGRTRNKANIVLLFDLINDHDPVVVMQAIRGLLPFKHEPSVKDSLIALRSHPNEMIQNIICKEFVHRNVSPKCNHTDSPKYLQNLIVQGNTLDILNCIPDESIHLTFTSPPYYNARDYSIYQSYSEYLKFLESVFVQIHRVTKEGRFFILNTSPVIVKRVSRQHSSKRYPIPYDLHPLLVNMGWEFIDDIVWVKPEASVKNRVAGFDQHRKPLAYKPNAITECIMVYRKKTDKLLDWNIRSYPYDIVNESRVRGRYETTNVWKIDPTFDKTHSAVFPIELCNRIIELYSYKGDLVFDPFGGSGTFGRASQLKDRYFLLTEIKSEYIERMMHLFNQSDIAHSNSHVNLLSYDQFKDFIKEKQV